MLQILWAREMSKLISVLCISSAAVCWGWNFQGSAVVLFCAVFQPLSGSA